MKKRVSVEVEIDLPPYLDDDFLKLFSQLDNYETERLKYFIEGMVAAKRLREGKPL